MNKVIIIMRRKKGEEGNSGFGADLVGTGISVGICMIVRTHYSQWIFFLAQTYLSHTLEFLWFLSFCQQVWILTFKATTVIS